MADFSYQMQQYNRQAVEDAIADLELELQDEKELEQKLELSDSEKKVAEATEFVAENKDAILDQHGALLSLNLALRAIVKNNKDTQALDTMYDELVNSEEYRLLATQMAEIKAMIGGIRDFLIQEGVRGRPPVKN